MRLPLLFATAVFSAVGIGQAFAQSPQFVPAYPLYCQGPLTTGAPSGGETRTHFIWAPTGAGAAAPGPTAPRGAPRYNRAAATIFAISPAR